MIRQAHRGLTLTQRFDKYADRLALAFSVLGLAYFILRIF